ncbi:GGDEF domain-containing protein [Siculibacillus lacustris]|uniref:GGDEF domain-containing protein n=2 Tax=Siculibacillus lacustris TaxID=1549641 RepID=A0A4Q9VT84_9HYPH|nr:GGDEF domain-containing protein [Siculibacillus lacustris]
MPPIAAEHAVSLAKLVIEHALQPIVEVHTGRVYGHEALMRGHDRLGLAHPWDLLDLAAEGGEIVRLERMLHARALARFTQVEAVGAKLFVNLDARAVTPKLEILDGLADAVGRAGVSPSSVVVELSERADHFANAAFPEFLRRLKSTGMRVAIDDFGTGFAELRLLCDHGIDYVKIDGHFLRGMATSQRKLLFVSTMSDLAHVLGVRVIAEGIETEADYIACREAGCDLVQGYFVARPQTEIGDLLSTYAHVVSVQSRHRRGRRSDGLLIRSELTVLPTVADGSTLEQVFELFRCHPAESFFPVVDAGGVPRGIVHERDLKRHIYNPFGRDLLRNKGFGHSVASFVQPCPIADVESEASRLFDIFTHSAGADGVIVTENQRYLGVLSTAALVKIMSEKQLRQARDQNPLTELPGNLSIADHVATTALDGDAQRLFCYFDFDDFKPFNDRYGFRRGDEAITTFANCLRREFVGTEVFLGHIGGDDFFAGFIGAAADEAVGRIERLLGEFRREVASLYPEQERRDGGIVGRDRDGRLRNYPLMRCSAAVLTLEPGTVTAELDRIGLMIADLKSEAKRSVSGLVVRRFED